MKTERQQTILQLVQSREIYTQGELTDALAGAGFSAAQATLSRDIRELGLTKEPTPKGLKYAIAKQADDRSLSRIFRDGLLSVDHAGNMLVLRTLSGMGMAVALALDEMRYPQVLGTVAGDDTVICVIRTEEQAAEIAQSLR